MFITRKHRFAANHGLSKRKLDEEFLHWASTMSRIGTDSYRVKTFDRSHIGINEFMIGSFDIIDGIGYNIKGQGQYVPIEAEVRNYNGPGVYQVSWSIAASIGNTTTHYVGAHPYFGGELLTHLGDVLFHPSYQETGDTYAINNELTLCGSGLASISNDTLRAGLIGFTNDSGEVLVTGASLAVAERLQ